MSGADPPSASERAAADVRRDRRGTRYAVVGLAVLLIGSYAAAVALSGDDMPAGTEVAGVKLGGLSTAAAEERLRTDLVPRAQEPIVLAARGQTFKIHPADAGLALDVEGTVERAQGGIRIDPRRLWADLTATVGPVPPVVEVDQAALIATVHRVDDEVERRPVEPWIGFAAERPVPHLPVAGVAVDTSQAIVTVLDAWLVETDRVSLPLETVPPEVGKADLERAVRRLARPAMDGPVRLRAGGRTFVVDPREYAPALRYEVVDGALAAVVDPGLLARRVPQPVAAGRRPARDAAVVLRRGHPAIVAARSGERIRPSDLATALTVALGRGDRTARVAGTPVPAGVSTEDARSWGIHEVVASASAPYREGDVVPLAARVNGTVVRPGGTFSLGGRLGPRSDGVADASQLATAIYGAAFAAGMEPVERHPHGVYDPRFPRGIDARLDWPHAGLRLAGTTPYGVLVQVSAAPHRDIAGGRLNVRLWSTGYWTVTTRTLGPYDRTRPGRRVSHSRGCEPVRGREGFTVRVVRDLHHKDRERHRITRTTYAPVDAVVCRPPRR